jgi:hypothetical protein
MSNRGCYLLLLFLALTGEPKSVSAQAAALQVQVYDYTGLSSGTLHQFITRTQEILTSAGISVEVDACARGVSTACESRRGSFRQVVIRVVPGAPRKSNDPRWQHLGQSIATHDGGTYASVFLKLAEEKAAETNLPRVLVLSYAAAHEVGHLLLGDEAHSAGFDESGLGDRRFPGDGTKPLSFQPGANPGTETSLRRRRPCGGRGRYLDCNRQLRAAIAAYGICVIQMAGCISGRLMRILLRATLISEAAWSIEAS